MPSFAPNLADATRQLYTTFRRYKVEKLLGCPCCTSDEHGMLLASRPLKNLTASDLEQYAFKAMTTWGTVSDFKHFLPRIFELAAHQDFESSSDVEVILGKLRYGDWDRWAAEERAAVTNFLY